jgi:hypothetical protein
VLIFFNQNLEIETGMSSEEMKLFEELGLPTKFKTSKVQTFLGRFDTSTFIINNSILL